MAEHTQSDEKAVTAGIVAVTVSVSIMIFVEMLA
jgi:hypothetical protein